MAERIIALADRLAVDRDFIAGHVSAADLTAALGCDARTAARIRLCWWPRERADVARIAARFGVDAARLAELLGSE